MIRRPACVAHGGGGPAQGRWQNLLALVIVDTLIVALLVVVVVGLLRSHADILRSLHQLGAGVGDPLASPLASPLAAPGGRGSVRADGGERVAPVPLLMGPPLPGERNSSSAPDVAGVTPAGDAKSIRLTGIPQRTLLAFLSSGCATCAGIWAQLGDPPAAGLPEDVRVVAVTKGPELEISAEVARRAAPGLLVVMSTAAWGDYEVPGSPFFVLVDGSAERRVGEGVATQLVQVAELVRRAAADAGETAAATRGRAFAAGLDGKARELENDAELASVGIVPGHPSLYPTALEDLFEPAPGPAPAGGRRAGGPPTRD